MKRYLLIIVAILAGFAVRAQSVTYTCRYWFDQNFAQAATATFGDDTWQAELDVGALPEGLHTLNLHVMDTSLQWSSPRSYLFMKTSNTQPAILSYHYWFDQNHAQMHNGTLGDGILLLDLDELNTGLHTLHVMVKGSEYTASQSYLFFKTDHMQQGTNEFVYHCWFDQDFVHQQSNSLGDGSFLLNVADIEDGMHTVNVMLEGSTLTATQSYLFMKLATLAMDTTDMSHLVYHCWFDQDFEHQQTDTVGDGHFLLDVNGLTDGLHSVNVTFEGSTGALASTRSYMFMKIAVQDHSAPMQYRCWFDQDYGTLQTGPVGTGVFELEVSDLKDGLHTVFVQLDNYAYTTPRCYMFYKRPVGGYIAKWEYWINEDFDDRVTTNLMPRVDTLDIISLLPVGHPALRSSCFHFHPNGEEPYINAKNQISFRIWDAEMRFMDMTRFYVDEQVQQDILAQVFERNTTETFAAPRDNQIQWFKLDAVVGDSLSFVASKACTMQLFAPSGEEVFNVSGPESIILKGLHAWEDGTYYLAVHDMTGSGETLSVTYNWIAKYVVLAYTPTEIGNTWGVFEVDVLGNGFDKLSNVLLTSGAIEWQMDTVMYSHISEAAIRFAMNSTTSNGNYDVVLCFEDQVGELDTLVLTSAIRVVEAQFGTIDIDYSYQFNTTPPYLITVTITNNGNVEYQGVPVLFAHTNVNNVDFGLYNDWITVQEDYFENGGRGIYYTNNLFNQGIEGNIIPLVLPKLGPYGAREITFVVDADRGTGFDFYAWGGIPWSVKTQEAYDADAYYCQTHPESPGWNGNHNGGNGGNSGSTHGSNGGSSGGASYTVGTQNANGGNCHGTASDAYFDSCDGPPDPCDIAGHVAGDIQECLCGVTMGIGQTLGNMLNAMHGLNHRAQLNGVGIHSQEEAEQYGLGDMWHSAYQRRLRTPGSLLRDAVGHCTGFLPDVAQHATDAGLEAWGMLSDDCAQPPRQSPSIPRPCEPNEIRGYVAESGSHYMMQEIQTITYEIESENDTTATAAAHTIIVRDTLDVNKFDVASLAAYRVTIHDKVLELSGEHDFVYTLDLRPNVYVIAQIQLECDDETGIVVWTITSLDPMTMESTTDPNQGALPINYNGEGIATFTFNVNLKEPFPDGTEISNRVGIIFDLEEPVITDTWTNTVDAVKPTSHIEEVTPVADSLSFSFVSEDNRSGVWYHSLYYRNASTEQEWQVRKAQIFEDSFVLHLEDLLTTEYLVIAVDSAGNREDKEMVAEYIYTASGLHFVTEGNWSTASNWQEGTLPGADDMVFIDAPCQLDQDAEVAALAINNCHTLTVQSGKTLAVNGLLSNTSAEGLVIKDGAQLINASGNVFATMEKDIVAYSDSNPDAWYTIASPMNEMPIEGSSFATPEFDLYRFNESNLTNEEWENYKGSLADFTTFENGRGYLFANSNAFSPAFTGTLNASAVSYPLSYTERPNDPLSGFNLIGNPFPHDIYKGTGAAIDNANLASGYYTLTNEGTWQVHTYEDAIHPGQGILVKATASTVLTIAKSTAVATSETGGAKRETSPLSISVKGENGMNQAFVYFGRGNSMEKLGGFVAQEPSLWVRDNGKDYAIAHMEKACETLELCFSSKQSGDFILTIDRNETEFEYLQLVDHVTGLTVDLLKQPTYGFHVTGQEPDARFSIRFKVTE